MSELRRRKNVILRVTHIKKKKKKNFSGVRDMFVRLSCFFCFFADGFLHISVSAERRETERTNRKRPCDEPDVCGVARIRRHISSSRYNGSENCGRIKAWTTGEQIGPSTPWLARPPRTTEINYRWKYSARSQARAV